MAVLDDIVELVWCIVDRTRRRRRIGRAFGVLPNELIDDVQRKINCLRVQPPNDNDILYKVAEH